MRRLCRASSAVAFPSIEQSIDSSVIVLVEPAIRMSLKAVAFVERTIVIREDEITVPVLLEANAAHAVPELFDFLARVSFSHVFFFAFLPFLTV